MNKSEPNEPQVLKPQQARFVDTYSSLGDVPAAARLVGIDRSTGWRWLQQRPVREALSERMQDRARRVQAALFDREQAAFLAIDSLLASADEKVRLRAATWLLDHALKLTADPMPAKTMAELQLEELEQRAIAEISGIRDESQDAR